MICALAGSTQNSCPDTAIYLWLDHSELMLILNAISLLVMFNQTWELIVIRSGACLTQSWTNVFEGLTPPLQAHQKPDIF